MPRDAGGWAEYVSREAPAGTRYRYRIDGEMLVPDPAARYQPGDVHGASEVVDPLAYAWRDGAWAGLPPERLVFYELHVGTFTPEGTFDGGRRAARPPRRARGHRDRADAASRISRVAGAGATTGSCSSLPSPATDGPEDLKALVDACHARGLAVFLDVVYNHFGPEGNYLHRYAPAFFSPRHRTLWGDGINYDGPGAEVVRSFMIHNTLYWLEEFHLDGLRLDAVNAIVDDSAAHLLVELGRAVAEGPGRERPVHLVLENGANEARYLERAAGRRPLYQAQWNDDVHHALHVPAHRRERRLLRGLPAAAAAPRALPHRGLRVPGRALRVSRRRCAASRAAHLPPTAFVSFLQNHDQVGNRALGERITALGRPEAVRAATAVLLLSPALPLLFMGQEWARCRALPLLQRPGPRPGPRRWRRAAGASSRGSPSSRDPARPRAHSRPAGGDHARAFRARLEPARRAEHQAWLALHRTLLHLRATAIVPLLAGEPMPAASWKALGDSALEVHVGVPGRDAAPGDQPRARRRSRIRAPAPDWGRRLHALLLPSAGLGELPPWSARVLPRGAGAVIAPGGSRGRPSWPRSRPGRPRACGPRSDPRRSAPRRAGGRPRPSGAARAGSASATAERLGERGGIARAGRASRSRRPPPPRGCRRRGSPPPGCRTPSPPG